MGKIDIYLKNLLLKNLEMYIYLDYQLYLEED